MTLTETEVNNKERGLDSSEKMAAVLQWFWATSVHTRPE